MGRLVGYKVGSLVGLDVGAGEGLEEGLEIGLKVAPSTRNKSTRATQTWSARKSEEVSSTCCKRVRAKIRWRVNSSKFATKRQFFTTHPHGRRSRDRSNDGVNPEL